MVRSILIFPVNLATFQHIFFVAFGGQKLKIWNMIFHSIQYISHFLCKNGHFWVLRGRGVLHILCNRAKCGPFFLIKNGLKSLFFCWGCLVLEALKWVWDYSQYVSDDLTKKNCWKINVCCGLFAEYLYLKLIGMADRYNIHSQLEHLQSKYIGTGECWDLAIKVALFVL